MASYHLSGSAEFHDEDHNALKGSYLSLRFLVLHTCSPSCKSDEQKSSIKLCHIFTLEALNSTTRRSPSLGALLETGMSAFHVSMTVHGFCGTAVLLFPIQFLDLGLCALAGPRQDCKLFGQPCITHSPDAPGQQSA